MNWLDVLADLATIVTATVAAYGYGSYRLNLHDRRLKIEAALKRKSAPNDDLLLVTQLAADFKLTVEQVVEAASRSNKIEGYGGSLGNERRLRYIQNSNSSKHGS